jgi:23S rRNA pseudouridine2605 synthase
LSRGNQESLVHITIRQGLNWQIRKILARVGLPVRSLRRTRIGSITDRGLSVGGFRELTKAEVAYLKKM